MLVSASANVTKVTRGW